MGVYIKGMEMPKSCAQCRCCRACPAVNARIAQMAENHWFPSDHRHPDCPLVPVPPHEDLIDRGKLIKRLERQIEAHEKLVRIADEKGIGYTIDMYIIDRNRDLISMLKALSAVIPAEEGE